MYKTNEIVLTCAEGLRIARKSLSGVLCAFTSYLTVICAVQSAQLERFPFTALFAAGLLLSIVASVGILIWSAIAASRSRTSINVALTKRACMHVLEGDYADSLLCLCARLKREGRPLSDLVCVVGFIDWPTAGATSSPTWRPRCTPATCSRGTRGLRFCSRCASLAGVLFK